MPSNQPKVSIVLPTYNREELLPPTLDSILLQDFTDFELIVVDDGSMDNTQQLIKKYQAKDQRIRYFFVPHNGILTKNRNYGMKQARGEYIAFMDSDDLWKQGKLRTQVDILDSHPEIGFTCCDAEYFNKKAVLRQSVYGEFKIKFQHKNVSLFLTYIQNEIVILAPAILFRKTCLATTGWMNEQFRATDYEFFARLAFYFTARLSFTPLVRVRRHDTNLSLVHGLEGFDEMLYVLDYFYENKTIDLKYYQVYRKKTLYRKGIQAYRKQHYELSLQSFSRCIKENSFFVKAYLWYSYVLIANLFREKTKN